MGICETVVTLSGNVWDALNVLLECNAAQKPRRGSWSAGGTSARSRSPRGGCKGARLIGIIATVNPPNELRSVISLSRQLLIPRRGMPRGRNVDQCMVFAKKRRMHNVRRITSWILTCVSSICRARSLCLAFKSGKRAKMHDDRSKRDSEIVRQIAKSSLKLQSHRSKGFLQKDERANFSFQFLLCLVIKN